ncbi:MAG: hypothetical protein N2506_06390 [Dehalococcoidales bacterium]|nr:hypothetical protein [Dehalococcoidales bacterium]
MPPLLMYLHIKGEDYHLWLPLPLFILYPILLALLLVLLPFLLAAFLIAWALGYGKWSLLVLRALFLACLVTCAMRGLRVDVKSQHGLVKVCII